MQLLVIVSFLILSVAAFETTKEIKGVRNDQNYLAEELSKLSNPSTKSEKSDKSTSQVQVTYHEIGPDGTASYSYQGNDNDGKGNFWSNLNSEGIKDRFMSAAVAAGANMKTGGIHSSDGSAVNLGYSVNKVGELSHFGIVSTAGNENAGGYQNIKQGQELGSQASQSLTSDSASYASVPIQQQGEGYYKPNAQKVTTVEKTVSGTPIIVNINSKPESHKVTTVEKTVVGHPLVVSYQPQPVKTVHEIYEQKPTPEQTTVVKETYYKPYQPSYQPIKTVHETYEQKPIPEQTTVVKETYYKPGSHQVTKVEETYQTAPVVKEQGTIIKEFYYKPGTLYVQKPQYTKVEEIYSSSTPKPTVNQETIVKETYYKPETVYVKNPSQYTVVEETYTSSSTPKPSSDKTSVKEVYYTPGGHQVTKIEERWSSGPIPVPVVISHKPIPKYEIDERLQTVHKPGAHHVTIVEETYTSGSKPTLVSAIEQTYQIVDGKLVLISERPVPYPEGQMFTYEIVPSFKQPQDFGKPLPNENQKSEYFVEEKPLAFKGPNRLVLDKRPSQNVNQKPYPSSNKAAAAGDAFSGGSSSNFGVNQNGQSQFISAVPAPLEYQKGQSQFISGVPAPTEYQKGQSQFISGVPTPLEYQKGQSQFISGVPAPIEYQKGQSQFISGVPTPIEYQNGQSQFISGVPTPIEYQKGQSQFISGVPTPIEYQKGQSQFISGVPTPIEYQKDISTRGSTVTVSGESSTGTSSKSSELSQTAQVQEQSNPNFSNVGVDDSSAGSTVQKYSSMSSSSGSKFDSEVELSGTSGILGFPSSGIINVAKPHHGASSNYGFAVSPGGIQHFGGVHFEGKSGLSENSGDKSEDDASKNGATSNLKATDIRTEKEAVYVSSPAVFLSPEYSNVYLKEKEALFVSNPALFLSPEQKKFYLSESLQKSETLNDKTSNINDRVAVLAVQEKVESASKSAQSVQSDSLPLKEEVNNQQTIEADNQELNVKHETKMVKTENRSSQEVDDKNNNVFVKQEQHSSHEETHEHKEFNDFKTSGQNKGGRNNNVFVNQNNAGRGNNNVHIAQDNKE